MKTFSRLSSFAYFVLVFSGIAFMLVGNLADAQQDGLLVETNKQAGDYAIGDTAEVRFTVTPEAEITLNVSWVGINVTSVVGQGGIIAGPHTSPARYTTDGDTGRLVVTGTVISSGAHVTAVWPEGGNNGLEARALLGGSPDAPRIVVGPPNVNGTGTRSPLQVGDTLTQQIWARDFLPPIITSDLSAWQMEITYNPQILSLVSVTEGDFLEEGGIDALFMADTRTRGKIKAYQARIGRQTTDGVETLTPAVPGVTGSGLLLTVEFKLLEFAEEALGLSNIQLSDSQLTAITDNASQASRESYHVVVNPIVATNRFPAVDVNRDGMVDVMDLVAIAGSLGNVASNPRTDVNNDGFVNALDLMAVASSASWGQAVATINIRSANNPDADGSAPVASVANVTPETIQAWIGLIQVEDDGSAIFNLGIANLEALLASRIPSETKLLLNYPNPFNPETWIPYQLAKATEVTVMIHSMNGSLIRTIELGHQAAGTYKSKSQAAYWDGRNELGEQVASGLYFYTLTAGDFTATHKMLVRK
ncbi:MAG: T9SS type A sorting domain-containing protein [Candidatus Poribacteria bacterium]|nr:T9SS type A sorting domain-containing protein [Candidatus Poribacteria bacterium]